jgi:endonuclease YncB( thermonuclease family)
MEKTYLLEEASWKNTIEFIPLVSSGKVIKVYDGDTICIATKFPYNNELKESNIIYRFHIRLLNIDTPEIKSKNENEKKIAKLAKDFLSSIIMDKMVYLKNTSVDKYGRILANVYTENNEDISNILLEKKFAVIYNGGTKKSPLDWEKYHNDLI